MYANIELWKAKSAWKELPAPDREAYLGQLASTIPSFVEHGVEISDWGWNDGTK